MAADNAAMAPKIKNAMFKHRPHHLRPAAQEKSLPARDGGAEGIVNVISQEPCPAQKKPAACAAVFPKANS